MSEIEITPLQENAFGVAVTEGDTTTNHRVTVPQPMLEDLGIDNVDGETVVRESFLFLLEREPATSILPEFALDQIARYFPEYYEELSRRVRG